LQTSALPILNKIFQKPNSRLLILKYIISKYQSQNIFCRIKIFGHQIPCV